MRQVSGTVAAFILAVGACGAVADDAKDGLKTLQGTWDLIYFERDGKEVKLQNDTKIINTGDKFVVQRGNQVIAAGTMKIDPSNSPMTSETTYTEGPDRGKTFKGIYQFEGDTVKFCRAATPDEERPTEFKSKPGSGQFVAIYKRASRTPDLQVLDRFIGTWDSDFTINQSGESFKTVENRRWSRNGQFVLSEDVNLTTNKEAHFLMTYDAKAKAYRACFIDEGNAAVYTGNWDQNSQTMTWKGKDASESSVIASHRFADNDHVQISVTGQSTDGKAVFDMTAQQVRRTQ